MDLPILVPVIFLILTKFIKLGKHSCYHNRSVVCHLIYLNAHWCKWDQKIKAARPLAENVVFCCNRCRCLVLRFERSRTNVHAHNDADHRGWCLPQLHGGLRRLNLRPTVVLLPEDFFELTLQGLEAFPSSLCSLSILCIVLPLAIPSFCSLTSSFSPLKLYPLLPAP